MNPGPVNVGGNRTPGRGVTPGQPTTPVTPSGDRRGGWNPYVPHRHDHDHNRSYGVVYGYPYYPFSYGWNPTWYGNNYGSYYNSYPYSWNNTGYNFSNDAQPQATVDVQSQQTTPNLPLVQPNDATAAQATVANAVAKSPALIAANGSVNQAQSAYSQAREQALANLRQQPKYQEALSRRHAAAQDVHKAQLTTGSTTQPTDAVVSAAQAKLDAGDDVTKMEEQAVAADPNASAAKARLEQATADRDTLKAQLTAQYQASVR